MDITKKENIQYSTAIVFLFTGILICFLSFFLSEEYDVSGGALTYLGEAVAFCAGVFSINLYVKSKVNEAESRIANRIDHRIDHRMREYEERIEN